MKKSILMSSIMLIFASNVFASNYQVIIDNKTLKDVKITSESNEEEHDKSTLNFDTMSIGQHVSYALKDNNLWVIGIGNYNANTMGDYQNRYSWTKTNYNDVKLIAAGSTYGFIVFNDDSLGYIGYNGYGNLGDGSKSNITSLKINNIFKSVGIKKIEAEMLSSTVLLNNGDLYSTGSSLWGSSGFSSDVTSWTLLKNNVKDFHSMGYALYVILNNGDVYLSGYNNNGYLGIGNKTTMKSLFKSTFLSGMDIKGIYGEAYSPFVLLNNGEAYASGYSSYAEIPDSGAYGLSLYWQKIPLVGISKITSGQFGAYAITNDGKFYKTGNFFSNYFPYNKWVNVPELDNVVSDFYSIDQILYFKMKDGKIMSIGKDAGYGNLGLGKNVSESIVMPTEVTIDKDIINQ